MALSKDDLEILSLRALVRYMLLMTKYGALDSGEDDLAGKLEGMMNEFINLELRNMGQEMSTVQLRAMSKRIARRSYEIMEQLGKDLLVAD